MRWDEGGPADEEGEGTTRVKLGVTLAMWVTACRTLQLLSNLRAPCLQLTSIRLFFTSLLHATRVSESGSNAVELDMFVLQCH